MTRDRLHLDDETLQALAAGRSDAAARAHLDGCPRCAEALDAYRVLFADLGALEDPAPDATFAAEVMARIDAAAAAAPARRRWAPLAATLAGVAAGIAAAGAWVFSGGSLAGILVDGARLVAAVAKLHTFFGDLLGALPPVASATLVVGQLFVLGMVLFGLTRLVGGEGREAVAEAA